MTFRWHVWGQFAPLFIQGPRGCLDKFLERECLGCRMPNGKIVRIELPCRCAWRCRDARGEQSLVIQVTCHAQPPLSVGLPMGLHDNGFGPRPQAWQRGTDGSMRMCSANLLRPG